MRAPSVRNTMRRICDSPSAVVPDDGSRRNRSKLLLRALLEPALPGVAARLRPVADVELAEHVADVRLDGLLADAEPLGDVLVAEALGDQREDFALALAQRLAHFAAGRRTAAEGVHQARGDARMQHGLASRGLAQRL